MKLILLTLALTLPIITAHPQEKKVAKYRKETIICAIRQLPYTLFSQQPMIETENIVFDTIFSEQEASVHVIYVDSRAQCCDIKVPYHLVFLSYYNAMADFDKQCVVDQSTLTVTQTLLVREKKGLPAASKMVNDRVDLKNRGMHPDLNFFYATYFCPLEPVAAVENTWWDWLFGGRKNVPFESREEYSAQFSEGFSHEFSQLSNSHGRHSEFSFERDSFDSQDKSVEANQGEANRVTDKVVPDLSNLFDLLPKDSGTGSSNLPKDSGSGSSNLPKDSGTGSSNLPKDSGADSSNLPKNSRSDLPNLQTNSNSNDMNQSQASIEPPPSPLSTGLYIFLGLSGFLVVAVLIAVFVSRRRKNPPRVI